MDCRELWFVDQERDLSEFVRLVSLSGLVEEFQAGSAGSRNAVDSRFRFTA